jgi:hypothetical protein
MLIREVSMIALLALLLPGCEGRRGPSAIEQGGANPCGPCEKGEFCLWSNGDEECTYTGCEAIQSDECGACFAEPSKCDARALAACTDGGSACPFVTDFESAELADDGTVVIYCSEANDTDCST